MLNPMKTNYVPDSNTKKKGYIVFLNEVTVKLAKTYSTQYLINLTGQQQLMEKLDKS